MTADVLITDFLQRLATPLVGELLFDEFDNLTYFVKDNLGRYISVNLTLVRRCGMKNKAELIGKTAAEVYPTPLGNHFLSQDLELVRTSRPLVNELEQHPYPRRQTGWCLTTKLPLMDLAGGTIGLVGMSRDVQAPDKDPAIYASVAEVIEHIKRNIEEPSKSCELAELVGLSTWQLDQRMRELFGVTTAQLILQTRMDAAAKHLQGTTMSIVDVALRVGYGDQSAFSRQFRKTFGLTPGEYRRSPRQ